MARQCFQVKVCWCGRSFHLIPTCSDSSYMTLASVGLLWVEEDLNMGDEDSQNRGASSLLPGKSSPAAHPVETLPSCSGSLSRSLPPTSVSASHFSLGAFFGFIVFSSHEVCLEEPSSDAMAESLSSYCFTVGKTSLITRFMYDSFDNTYQVRSWVPLTPPHPWYLQP